MKSLKKSILHVVACMVAVPIFGAPYLPQNGENYMPDGKGGVLMFGGNAASAGIAAIKYDSNLFTGWVAGYTNLSYGALGSPVDDEWKIPEKALGQASDSVYDIVCLGDGGQITLTFLSAITNGQGGDFAIFENSFNDSFLELAYVEVSTDGEHFLRFPNFYLGVDSIGPYDNTNYPEYIYNLASKYEAGYGHSYDLQELQYAYDYALNTDISESSFSEEYTRHILDNFQNIDLNEINYIKIIDIKGDGTCKDSAGNAIYDPDPCYGSPGFDLNGVGVINQIPEPATYTLALAIFSLTFSIKKRRFQK